MSLLCVSEGEDLQQPLLFKDQKNRDQKNREQVVLTKFLHPISMFLSSSTRSLSSAPIKSSLSSAPIKKLQESSVSSVSNKKRSYLSSVSASKKKHESFVSSVSNKKHSSLSSVWASNKKLQSSVSSVSKKKLQEGSSLTSVSASNKNIQESSVSSSSLSSVSKKPNNVTLSLVSKKRYLSCVSSKSKIQYKQTGYACPVEGVTSPILKEYFPILMGPLKAWVGVGVIDEAKYYRLVVCLRVIKEGEQFYLNSMVIMPYFKEYSTNRIPMPVQGDNIRVENLVVTKDGEAIYLVNDGGEFGPENIVKPHIILFNMRLQACSIIALPAYVEKSCEFAIAKWGEALCMISYCSSMNTFSVWLHMIPEDRCCYEKIFSIPLDDFLQPWEGHWLKIHEVSTLESFLIWPGPVECFAVLRDINLLAIAMQDGSLYDYDFNNQSFTLLDQSMTEK